MSINQDFIILALFAVKVSWSGASLARLVAWWAESDVEESWEQFNSVQTFGTDTIWKTNSGAVALAVISAFVRAIDVEELVQVVSPSNTVDGLARSVILQFVTVVARGTVERTIVIAGLAGIVTINGRGDAKSANQHQRRFTGSA